MCNWPIIIPLNWHKILTKVDDFQSVECYIIHNQTFIVTLFDYRHIYCHPADATFYNVMENIN